MYRYRYGTNTWKVLVQLQLQVQVQVQVTFATGGQTSACMGDSKGQVLIQAIVKVNKDISECDGYRGTSIATGREVVYS